MPKHIYSFFNNEQDCIKSILKIHCPSGIDLDPMYNKGMFYKDDLIKKPTYRYDLNAIKNNFDAEQGDATNLCNIENETIMCEILDPPFMFGVHGKTLENTCVKRYSMFKDYNEMYETYLGIIKEAYRVLKKKGILIFKCQDYTDNKTYMTHCLVYEIATKIGFYAKDIAILNLEKPKIYNGNLKQKHLRKTHCYFWVFEKGGKNVRN